jgi:hypothetical protein
VEKFIKLWWGRVRSPYLRRAFIEAPRDNFLSRTVRNIIDEVRVPFNFEKIIPFRKAEKLDKKQE